MHFLHRQGRFHPGRHQVQRWTRRGEPMCEATSQLVRSRPDAVFLFGDQQYEDATLAEFRASFAPSWGRFQAVTSTSPRASPWTYFGKAAGNRSTGWRSYNIGDWHVIVLNSSGRGRPAPQTSGARRPSAPGPAPGARSTATVNAPAPTLGWAKRARTIGSDSAPLRSTCSATTWLETAPVARRTSVPATLVLTRSTARSW